MEVQLQKEKTQALQAQRLNSELQDEHRASCDLAQSKDHLLELGQAEIIQLRVSLSQATALQEEQGTRWDCKSVPFLNAATTLGPKNALYAFTDIKRIKWS